MTNSLLASLNAVAIRTVQIQSNEEVVTKTVKQFNPEIPYFGRYAVTPSNTAELCHNVKDSRDLFMSLSPSATWLIWTLDKLRDKNTNIARLQPKKLSDADRARYSRAKIELETLNVVLPVKSTYFLINPTVFIPDNSTFEAVLHHWIALGGKL